MKSLSIDIQNYVHLKFVMGVFFIMTNLKREIWKKASLMPGGLFYQYRSYLRDVATLYNIENLRQGVVDAQIPLNMNDLLDSMTGFSPK